VGEADIALFLLRVCVVSSFGRGQLGVVGLVRNNTGSLSRRPRFLGPIGIEEAGYRWGRGAMTQSAMTAARAGLRLCLCGLLAVSAAGCGISSITSGLGTSIFGGGSSKTAEAPGVNEEQLLSAAKASGDGEASSSPVGEIAAGCPRLSISPRGGNLTIYEEGRAGDGLAIMHRGEITKTARECHIEPGRVTVKYGFSGRVLLGPRGQAGNITLPVNVVVTDAKRDRIATDRLNVAAAVAVDNPIGYFSAVRTVTFEIPEGTRPGEFEVFVGFEQNAQGAG